MPTNLSRFGIAFSVALLGSSTLLHADSVMTFDLLDADFADHATHSENGITFAAVDGPGEFFRADGFFGDTSAALFLSDGDPFEIRVGGGLFDLIQLDFEDFELGTVALLTSSSGGHAAVANLGTFVADSSFSQVDWVRLSFESAPGLDPYYVVDNITLRTVIPEAGTWSTGLLVAAVAWIGHRRTRTPQQNGARR